MKTKIIITLIIIAFLYFSHIYLIPFRIWLHIESKGIVESSELVPGAMGYNTLIKYRFTVDGKTYRNADEQSGDNYDYKTNDTITVCYISFYPTENWCLFEKTLKP